MESETSDTTDSISTDLISSVFTKLQDHKPPYLNEVEHAIFFYFGYLSYNFHSVAYSGYFSLAFILIQLFVILCIAPISYGFTTSGVISDPLKALMFFINFNVGDIDKIPSCTFFLVLDFLSFVSVCCFTWGLVMIFKKKHMKSSLLIFLYVSGLSLSAILLLVEANYSSKIISQLLTGKTTTYYFQAIYSLVSFILHFTIQILASCTIYQSVFFFYGRFSQFNGMNLVAMLYIMFSLIIISHNISCVIMSETNRLIFMSLMYGIFGLISLYNGLGSVGFDNFLNVTARSYGCVLILSSIFGFFQISRFIVDPRLIVFLLFWGILILFFSFLYDDRRRARNLNQFFNTSQFDKFNIRNDLEFMTFVQIGFREARNAILNGDFIKWGLKRKRENWVYFGLLKFSTVLFDEPCYDKEINHHIEKTNNKTFPQKYILFEHFLSRNFQNTSDVPKDHHSAIAELEGRIAQFQSINKSFAKKISSDGDTNFLLIDALGCMRELISSNMKITKAIFPNSPEVLNLYSVYKSKIEGDQESSNKWASLANRLQSKEIIFANFQHTHCLDLFPKVQAKLLATPALIHTSDGDRKKFKVNQVPTETYVPVSKTVHDSNQALDVFNYRKNVLQYCFGITFFLMFAAILLDYCLCYSNTLLIKSKFVYCLDFNTNLTNVILAATSWLYLPLDMISRKSIRNVTITQRRVDEFKESYLGLGDMYKNMEYKSGTLVFSSYFDWMKENLFMITSNTGMNVINEDFIVYLSRFYTLFYSIFPVGIDEIVYSPEVFSLVNILQNSSMNFVVALFKNHDSGVNYLNFQLGTHKLFLYGSTIFVIVICALMLFLPLILYHELKILTSLFPQNSKKDISLLRTFLNQFFHTFKYFVAVYIFLIFVVVLISVFNIEIVYHFYIKFLGDFLEKMEEIINDELHVTYISNSLVSVLLSQKMFANMTNTTILKNNLNESVKFFTNGSRTYDTLLYSRVNQFSYEFLLNVIHQMDKENIIFNATEAKSMMRIFEQNTMPIIQQNLNQSFVYLHSLLQTTDVNAFTTVEITSFIIFGVFFAIYKLFDRLKSAIPVIIQMLTYLPDDYIATSEKFNNLFQSRGQVAQNSEATKNNVLDYVNRPCAVIDRNKDIIITNRLWFTYFDTPIDNTIGQPISQFMNESITKFTVTDISDNYQLIVINQLKEDMELSMKLKILKHKVQSLQSVMIPRRFIGKRKPGVERISFIMVCGLIFSPANNDDVNPEEWIAGVKLFENWIEMRCKETEDYDILKNNGRELMILFGINETNKPDILLLQAMTILVDILRWGIEYNWKGGGINSSITVSSGDEAEFVFRHDRATTMDMFGPAFEKQMTLREKIELNSIVCCAETEMLFRKFKCGFQLDQVDDVFVFSIGQNQNDVQMSQGELNQYSYDI